MKPNILNSLLAVALAAVVTPVCSQESAADSPMALARSRAAAYTSAFDKGDAAALGALFTEDAEYTLDTGETVSSRSEIEQRSKAFLSASPDAQIEILVESARLLTPKVLVEKGVTTVSGAGDVETTRYAATHILKEGKWLIADIQEAPLAEPDASAEAMASLDWLIGKWEVATEGIDGETEAVWTLGGRFITRTSRIPRQQGETFVSVEVIGFDPSRGQIRSWTFDNEGGFGDATWRSDGNKWLIRSTATLPEGGRSSSEHIVTAIGEGRYGFDTVNRVLDGEMLPNRDRIEIVRVSEENQPTTEK